MGRTVQLSQCLRARKLVTLDNLTRVKTHDEQTLCSFEEFSSKNHHRVGSVSHLNQGFELRAQVDKCDLPLILVLVKPLRAALQLDERLRFHG